MLERINSPTAQNAVGLGVRLAGFPLSATSGRSWHRHNPAKSGQTQPMLHYRFRTAPRYSKHYRANLLRMPKERLRGVIRGNASRERSLVPGAVKARVRRQRWRLNALYTERFGAEEFLLPFREVRLQPLPVPRWLNQGYAFWNERVAAKRRA